ncbi:MAG: cysteine--tRNA ligase [Pelagibacteraceae bacterium]
MPLKITNSLSRTKENFVPIDKDNIRMYVCGPTVYDYPHVGNARPLIVFDILFRLLKKLFPKSKITYVRNITDIDDKIIEASRKSNIATSDLTNRVIDDFHNDCAYLGCLKPSVEPKATDHLEEMINLIKILVDKGFAYQSNNHIYFAVSKFKQYGKLSNKNIKELVSGSRVEISENKKEPGDFVLWKPSEENEPSWDSPFGKGRPGWHLECSAMSEKYLGKYFDFHGGGLDLIFPHHENEIAQSVCANDNQKLANFWMHNGYVTVNKKKMSKSLGNFITINELKHNYNGQIIRLAMLSTHYTQPFDWNENILEVSKKNLEKWYEFYSDEDESVNDENLKFLLDDLNTPLMISNINDLYKKAKSGDFLSAKQLSSSCKILGLFNQSEEEWKNFKKIGKIAPEEIEKLILKRNEARAKKDFETSDKIRDLLVSKGVLIKDKDGNTVWEYK